MICTFVERMSPSACSSYISVRYMYVFIVVVFPPSDVVVAVATAIDPSVSFKETPP